MPTTYHILLQDRGRDLMLVIRFCLEIVDIIVAFDAFTCSRRSKLILRYLV